MGQAPGPPGEQRREERREERMERGGIGLHHFSDQNYALQASIRQIIGLQLEVLYSTTTSSIKCRLQSLHSDVTSVGNSM
jgi:hypothetical protein